MTKELKKHLLPVGKAFLLIIFHNKVVDGDIVVVVMIVCHRGQYHVVKALAYMNNGKGQRGKGTTKWARD